MKETTFLAVIATLVASVILMIITSITVYYINLNDKIEKLVEKGASTQEADCLYNEIGSSPQCIIIALKKED